MAIVSSTIRIYEDAQLTQLKDTITTSGSGQPIDIDNLDAGSVYWSTAQVTDDQNLTSEESAPYRFYTLPDVDWFNGPYASINSISAQLEGITDVVQIRRYGICYAKLSDFSDAVYYDQEQGGVDIYGLDENTFYYLKPYCIDEFNRRWVNDDAETYVTTGVSVPIVTWAGLSAVGTTTFSTQVNVNSSTTVSSVVATLTPSGGSPQTITLTAQTGVQNVNITGLSPNVSYSLYISAVNTGGTGTSSTLSFTTTAAAGTVEVNIMSAVVSNSTNVISAESRATYDSNIITITGHWIDLYSNDTHTGTADESVSGGATAVMSQTLSHANPDETYYLFGRVTYTVSGDNTIYTAWSEPYEVQTYSLLSFGAISTTSTGALIPYSVAGDATSIELEYSIDNSTWIAIPAVSLSGGTVNLSGLTPSTDYYVRGRVKSAAGWSDYATTRFTTDAASGVNLVITGISDITYTAATVNLSINL